MAVSALPRLGAVVLACLALGGCALSESSGDADDAHPALVPAPRLKLPKPARVPRLRAVPPPSRLNVYAADAPNALSPVVRRDPLRIYVPDSMSNAVDEIDPATRKVVRHFSVGRLPQHVAPSYDLRRLWVTNDLGNSLTPIDPRTGQAGRPVPVADPYNLYFTPDGRYAVVVAEALNRLDFRDAQTMKLHRSVPVPCRGIDHADFTADGRYMLASCEFTAEMVRIDVRRQRLAGVVKLPPRAEPQDVKLAPDGTIFYVADRTLGGVDLVSATDYRPIGFIRTAPDAHGLFVSRDARWLYVTNRSSGTVSVISIVRQQVVRTWKIPHGSPDMGGLTPDGKTLWVSGRYGGEVYAIDTDSGRLEARIHVGLQPHGLAVFPQPGRFSLGHTGVFR